MVVDKIRIRNAFVDSIPSESSEECQFHGKLLIFEQLYDGEMVWSGKYGARIVSEGVHSVVMTIKTKVIDGSIDLKLIIPDTDLNNLKLYFADIKNDNLRPINTPYSSEILEICTLTADSIDITYNYNYIKNISSILRKFKNNELIS